MTAIGTCLLNSLTKLTESDHLPRFMQRLLHSHDIRYFETGILSFVRGGVMRLMVALTNNANPNATGRL